MLDNFLLCWVTVSVFVPEQRQGLPIESIHEPFLKVLADKDHDEELARVMAVYRDTDLQQYKLESQLSLLPEMVQVMGYNTSRFNVADLLDFFQSCGNVH